jgi:hypothetical protein
LPGYWRVISYHCGVGVRDNSRWLNVLAADYPLTSASYERKTTERLCTRARYCDVECAAVLPHFLFWLSARSGSVFRQLRDNARKSWALGRAD